MEKRSNTCLEQENTVTLQYSFVNPIILDDPWDEPEDLDTKITNLLEEREPFLISVSRHPPYKDSAEFSREVELAKNKLVALGSSLRTVLRRIYKIASQNSIFTRVGEARNQHLIRAR